MTDIQKQQFNRMLKALNEIARDFERPDVIREISQTEWGLDYEEALEMSYENIQSTAEDAMEGIEEIK